MPWKFKTTCETIPQEKAHLLFEMERKAKEISYDTAVRRIGTDELKRIFPMYNWGRGKGLRLKNDRHVSYYLSIFDGKRCVGVDWSAIDHIWTLEEENGME